jgi:hypothetical protein
MGFCEHSDGKPSGSTKGKAEQLSAFKGRSSAMDLRVIKKWYWGGFSFEHFCIPLPIIVPPRLHSFNYHPGTYTIDPFASEGLRES